MDLNFQNFDSVNTTNEQSGGFGGSIGDRKNLVGGDGSSSAPSLPMFAEPTRKSNLFSLDYYQQFFDVETDQVMKRLLNSVVPSHRNYIQDFLQPIPDLWGPFWVSVTLVFSIGIFGNLAQFVENQGDKGSYGSDFRMVTSASTIIFLYVVVVPFLLYGLFWNRRSEMMHPYVDLMCLYGYSLTIFIPVTFLWIIDISWFRWALIFVSVGLSGSVLGRAIWPAIKNDTNKMIAFGTVIIVVLLHFLLAFTFKEFYFDAMHPIKLEKSSVAPIDVTRNPAAALMTSSSNETDHKPAAENMIAMVTNLSSTAAQPAKVEKRDSSEVTKEDNEAGNSTTLATTATTATENSTDSTNSTLKKSSEDVTTTKILEKVF